MKQTIPLVKTKPNTPGLISHFVSQPDKTVPS